MTLGSEQLLHFLTKKIAVPNFSAQQFRFLFRLYDLQVSFQDRTDMFV